MKVRNLAEENKTQASDDLRSEEKVLDELVTLGNVRGVGSQIKCFSLGCVLPDATVTLPSCSFFFSRVSLLLEVSLHYIVLHCSILSSNCLPSSLVLEFLFLLPQLFDFRGIKVIENTVQRSSPHKCGQESCCNAFNAVVAAFSQDISASLSLPCTLEVYLHLWNFLEGGLRGSRGPPHRHMPDPRRVFLSDQYPQTLICSTVSYGVSL